MKRSGKTRKDFDEWPLVGRNQKNMVSQSSTEKTFKEEAVISYIKGYWWVKKDEIWEFTIQLSNMNVTGDLEKNSLSRMKRQKPEWSEFKTELRRETQNTETNLSKFFKYNKDSFRFYTGQSTLEPWTQIVLPNNIM